jgi:hypothetical protein
MLQLRLQIAFCLRILFFVEIFAVARAVVEPHFARQLLIAVRRMSNALADGRVSTQRAAQSRAHGRSMFAQIQAPSVRYKPFFHTGGIPATAQQSPPKPDRICRLPTGIAPHYPQLKLSCRCLTNSDPVDARPAAAPCSSVFPAQPDATAVTLSRRAVPRQNHPACDRHRRLLPHRGLLQVWKRCGITSPAWRQRRPTARASVAVAATHSSSP